MNKVVTINLGGTAFQLEEAGYDLLRNYLESGVTRLQGNPDREEILSDIEWAIAEKFRGLLSGHKTVVITREVSTILTEMGPIEADSGEPAAGGAAGPSAMPGGTAAGAAGMPPREERGPAAGRPPKRLHRICEGEMIAGVCNGLAAYVHVDPTLIRLAFVFLTMLWGTGLLVYIVLAIVVPEATTAEQKAAATGDPFTAQEFIRRAREGYYEAVKGFPDRQARREWRRRFRREMREHAAQWRWSWHSHWAERIPGQPGMGFALPVLSLLHGIVNVVWICLLVSLLASGTIFGRELPDNVPVWLAVIILFALWGIFAGPLKLARQACQWGIGRSHPALSLIYLVDGIVWLVVVLVMIWLGLHYFPEVRNAIHSVPGLIQDAITDIRNWWNSK